jgi:hypothetical protein
MAPVARMTAYALFLGTGYELDPKAKRPKGDLDLLRKMPVMRLSMVVQRVSTGSPSVSCSRLPVQ